MQDRDLGDALIATISKKKKKKDIAIYFAILFFELGAKP